MIAAEQSPDIRNGRHWLCRIAESNGLDALAFINERDLWNTDCGAIARAIIEAAAERNGQERQSKIIASVTPWEKAALRRVCETRGQSMEEFLRETMAEKCAVVGPLPKPFRRDDNATTNQSNP